MRADLFEKSKKRFFDVGYLFILILIFGIILWLLSQIQSIVAILVVSIFMAYILFPIVRFFENPIVLRIPEKLKILKKEIKLGKEEKRITIRKKGFKKIVSVIIVYLIVALLIFILMSFVIPNLTKEFNKFVQNFPALSQKIMRMLNNFNDRLSPRLPESARDIVPRTIKKITAEMEIYVYEGAQYTLLIAQRVLSTTLAFLVIPIFTFYILIDLEWFKKIFYKLIPQRRKEEITGLMSRIDNMLGSFIRGQIIVSLFIAFAITIALLILDIDYAFLIGLLSGIVNFIPYLGVIIGLIPAIALALIYKGFWWAVLVTCVLIAIQQLEGQVISPAIMGEAVGLPPLVIILAIVVGGQVMGFLGMLIAIPTVAILKVILDYYTEGKNKAEKKEMQEDIMEIEAG
ncbi:MAG: AI-2E family transporter [Candidatus Eremiobacteraeota bacterium]|nr:AI-2E family transporter [Candidatus Eremiobacteraeota bacterium]